MRAWSSSSCDDRTPGAIVIASTSERGGSRKSSSSSGLEALVSPKKTQTGPGLFLELPLLSKGLWRVEDERNERQDRYCRERSAAFSGMAEKWEVTRRSCTSYTVEFMRIVLVRFQSEGQKRWETDHFVPVADQPEPDRRFPYFICRLVELGDPDLTAIAAASSIIS